MMLTNVVTLHQPQLSGLANSWLAAGAEAFAVWENDNPLISWPSGIRLNGNSLSAEIKIGNKRLGELMVVAPDSPANRMRLEAEANLIASLATIDQEMFSGNSLMEDAGDQMLDLYQIIHTADMELKSTLEYVAKEVARRVKAGGIFVSAHLPDGLDYWIEYGHVPNDRQWLDNCIEQLGSHDLPLLQFIKTAPGQTAEFTNLLLLSIPDHGVATMVLGLIRQAGKGFSEREQELVKTLAGYAGLQIEYAILSEARAARAKLDLELKLAKHVQARLLPQQTPEVAGLDVFARTQPASSVGGDFYDFISKPDNPFSFTVCDISGKGVPAAMMVAMTRMVIRGFASSQPTPAAVIGNTNAVLYEDFSQVNMLATMFIGKYEQEERVLHYANAGHAPVIYYSVQEGSRLLEADCPPIGVIPTSCSNNQQLTLGPGDVLVAGTDGLNEARNQKGELFGIDALMQLVAAVADLSAQEIADALREAVKRFTGGGILEDDQTMVVCKGV